MNRIRLEYLPCLFLAGVCLTLAFNSAAIAYIAPTTTDKFEILDYNIDYLSNLTLRHDRMLEIIYFGFLAVLFYLSFWCGRTQSKVRMLEDRLRKMEEWARVTRAAKEIPMHPAYRILPRARALPPNMNSIVDGLVRTEVGRAADIMTFEAMQKNIKDLYELKTQIAAREGPFRRSTVRPSTPEVLASQRQLIRTEMEILCGKGANKDEKAAVAPPAHRHEEEASAKHKYKSGDV